MRLPDFNEFIIGICSRSRASMLDELRQRRSALDKHRLALNAEVGDDSLSAQDIALAILLPGGLLYAPRIAMTPCAVPKPV